MHISELPSKVNAHAQITFPNIHEIKITDWDYMDEWKRELRRNRMPRIMWLFRARTACISRFGDSLLVPFCIIKAGNTCTQHALATPTG